MRTVNAKCGAVIPIGRLGENEATAVVFDAAEYEQLFGAGTFSLLHQRSGDALPYPCSVEYSGSKVTWIVKSADVAVQGYGKCELIYTVGGMIAKSVVFTTITGTALTGGAEPPEPWEDWVERVLEAGAAAQEAKEQWENMSAEAETLPAGTPATASYSEGVLHLGIPKGSNDHNELLNRGAANQHPISAITNLQQTLDGKANNQFGKEKAGQFLIVGDDGKITTVERAFGFIDYNGYELTVY